MLTLRAGQGHCEDIVVGVSDVDARQTGIQAGGAGLLHVAVVHGPGTQGETVKHS